MVASLPRKQAHSNLNHIVENPDFKALISLQDYLYDNYPVLSSRMVARISKYVEREFHAKKTARSQK